MSQRTDSGSTPEGNDPNEFSLFQEDQSPQEDYPSEEPTEQPADGLDAAAEVAEWIEGDEEPVGDDDVEGDAYYGAPDTEIAAAELTADEPRGGMPWMILGAAVLLVGIAVPLVGEPLLNALAQLGPAGTGLVCTGLALLAIGAVSRSVGTGRNRMEQVESGLCEARDTTARIEALVDHLVGLQQNAEARRPASGEELDRVLMLLQRQDEKTNNLTRAFKMFGKPLIEVTNTTNDAQQTLQTIQDELAGLKVLAQGSPDAVKDAVGPLTDTVTEIYNQLAAVRSTTEGQPEKFEESVARLETTVRGTTEALKATHQEQVDAFESLEQKLEDLQERTKTMIAGLADTAPDPETFKTQLGEAVQAPLGKLSETLESNTSKLTAELEKLAIGQGDSGKLDSAVAKMQNELAGLGTTLANIQHKLSQGVTSAPAPAAPAAPAPQAAAPAAPSAPAAPAPQTKAQGALGGGNKSAETAEYSSGERKASNKNVLGAIAKLKQMRN